MNDINVIQAIALGIAQQAIADDKAQAQYAVTTSDDTATDILTLTPDDQTAGMLEVTVIGFDGTDAVTGKKQVRYRKTSDTVTLGTVGDIAATVADGTLATASFSIVADSGSIKVQVTGVAGSEIDWIAEYKFINVFKQAILP